MAYSAVTGSDGAVTSFVPLTTTFTVPSSCSSIFNREGPSIVAFDPGYGISINPTLVCQPRAVTTWWNQGALGNQVQDHTAVSVGPITCPLGFATVATYVPNTSSTQVMCCPSGYDLANYDGGSVSGNCQSSITSGQVYTLAYTPTSSATIWSTTTTTARTASYAGAIAIVGWNLQQQVVAQTSTTSTSISTTQMVAASSSSSSLSTTGSTAITTDAASTSAPPASASSSAASISSTASGLQASAMSNSSNDLPTGTKVGVGVGVAMGVILFILLGILIWVLANKKHKSQSRADQGVRASPEEFYQDPHATFAGKAYPQAHQLDWTQRSEMQANPVSQELPGASKTGEMNGIRSPVELSGDVPFGQYKHF